MTARPNHSPKLSSRQAQGSAGQQIAIPFGQTDDESFVPLGDSLVTANQIEIRPAKRPQLPASNLSFTVDYVPAFGPIRRARRMLLNTILSRSLKAGRAWSLCVSPWEMVMLRQQEMLDLLFWEALRFLFGPHTTWRHALAMEEPHDPESAKELSQWLAYERRRGDSAEAKLFIKAGDDVQKVIAAGPFHRARYEALLFVMCRRRGDKPDPTRREVREHLRKLGIALPRLKDEVSRLFVGPILNALQRDRPGPNKH
jgi:hypothetical protein